MTTPQNPTNGTVYNINFDFTRADQKTILQYLQNNNYSLYGFKGASGPNQVKEGVPVWFTVPFEEMFGNVDIAYEPLYKVYAFNQHEIAPNTTIKMDALSIELPLGTSIEFNADGTFSNKKDAPAGSISIINQRPAGTPNITVGLAAKVNGIFQPFCAFTCTPQGSVNMAPHETVCLFAAQADLKSGSVVGNAAAPGCSFVFDSNRINYSLEMLASTYGINSTPGGTLVTTFGSNASLNELLNS